MQPIVGRYTDKNNNDFIATNGLVPIISFNPRSTIPPPEAIGDIHDYLFAKAISLITGLPYETRSTRSVNQPQFKPAELYPTSESIRRQAVIIDNPALLPSGIDREPDRHILIQQLALETDI